MGWENIENALKAGKAAATIRLPQRYPLIDDVEKEIGWWACFEENKKRKSDLPKVRFVSPLAKARVKVGRNDPCPCGSGKNSRNAAARMESKAEAPRQNDPSAAADFRMARSGIRTRGQLMRPIRTRGYFMGPIGQVFPDRSVENKGGSYGPRPTYGSKRGRVMGIVTKKKDR
jgi:SEC-C motif